MTHSPTDPRADTPSTPGAAGSDRVERIREKLQTLQPTMLEIADESHLHAGHVGARGGGGHYVITISAPALQGLPRVRQHQKIYNALGDMMKAEIHALKINVV